MGQFLQVGICFKFCVDKEELERCDISKERLLVLLKENSTFDLNNYSVSEDSNYFIFKIKENILNGELIKKFLDEQYILFNIEKDYKEEIFKELENLNTADDVIDCLERKSFRNFQYSKNNDYLHLKKEGSGYYSVYTKFESALFYINGKTYMECYVSFCEYMVRLIQYKNNNPLSGCVRVFLD